MRSQSDPTAAGGVRTATGRNRRRGRFQDDGVLRNRLWESVHSQFEQMESSMIFMAIFSLSIS